MIQFGGSNMNDRYWEKYKEFLMAGDSHEVAMRRAHEYMIGIT